MNTNDWISIIYWSLYTVSWFIKYFDDIYEINISICIIYYYYNRFFMLFWKNTAIIHILLLWNVSNIGLNAEKKKDLLCFFLNTLHFFEWTWCVFRPFLFGLIFIYIKIHKYYTLNIIKDFFFITTFQNYDPWKFSFFVVW